MIDDLSIRSDGGGVGNLAWNDLAIIHGHDEGVRWWLVVGGGRCPVRLWGAMVGRWGAIVRIRSVRQYFR